MGNTVLDQLAGNVPLGFGGFLITQGAVFVLCRFLKIILNPYLAGSVQVKEKRQSI